MANYSINERAKCAAWYECMKSTVLVQRKYNSIFGKNSKAPNSASIRKWHKSLMEIGSVCDLIRKRERTAVLRHKEKLQIYLAEDQKPRKN